MISSHLATPATALEQALASGRQSAQSLAQLCLARIERDNARLQAVVALDARAVLREAARRDRERAEGRVRGPLHGLPILVKDLIDVAGMPTRAGSRLTSSTPRPRSAVLVRRLQQAGLVILGKTATVEFAFGGWGTNAAVGGPLNPWSRHDSALAPGGSSSGSAAAVAAGFAPFAFGTDTGGSVRIPASLCGITALKTSPRAVSRAGIVPLAPTLDSIGPMALTAADLQPLFDAMRGVVSTAAPTPSFAGLRVGLFDEAALGEIDASVGLVYARALHFLQERGARVSRLAAPPWEILVEDTGIIIGGEGWRMHRAMIDGRLDAMDPAVAARFATGRTVTDAQLRAARRRRREQAARYRQVFDDFDILLTPTTPIPAQPFVAIDEARLPLSRFTRAANYLDLAAVSFPAPLGGNGLPTGIQLLAPYGRESDLLSIVAAWQNEEEWRPRIAPGFAAFSD